jgi:hypothetical protein
MEKEICNALHVQMDVGNTINIVNVQHLMINIMDAKNLGLLRKNERHYIMGRRFV